MKKISTYILTLLLTLMVATPALAQSSDFADDIRRNLDPVEDVYNPGEPIDGGTFPELIARIINVFLSFLGIVFLGLMIYGGYMWMTAAGNDSKIDKAKKIITSAVIGTFIILVSYGVVWFVTTQLLEATGAQTF